MAGGEARLGCRLGVLVYPVGGEVLIRLRGISMMVCGRVLTDEKYAWLAVAVLPIGPRASKPAPRSEVLGPPNRTSRSTIRCFSVLDRRND